MEDDIRSLGHALSMTRGPGSELAAKSSGSGSSPSRGSLEVPKRESVLDKIRAAQLNGEKSLSIATHHHHNQVGRASSASMAMSPRSTTNTSSIASGVGGKGRFSAGGLGTHPLSKLSGSGSRSRESFISGAGGSSGVGTPRMSGGHLRRLTEEETPASIQSFRPSGDMTKAGVPRGLGGDDDNTATTAGPFNSNDEDDEERLQVAPATIIANVTAQLQEARQALKDLNTLRKAREEEAQSALQFRDNELGTIRSELEQCSKQLSEAKATGKEYLQSLLDTRSALAEAKARSDALSLHSENKESGLRDKIKTLEASLAQASAATLALEKKWEEKLKEAADEHSDALTALKKQNEAALVKANHEAENARKHAVDIQVAALTAEHEAAVMSLKDKQKKEVQKWRDAAEEKDAHLEEKGRTIRDLESKKEKYRKEVAELQSQLEEATKSWSEEAEAHGKIIEGLNKKVADEKKKADAAAAAEAEAKRFADECRETRENGVNTLKRNAADLVAAETAVLQLKKEAFQLHEALKAMHEALAREKVLNASLSKDLKRALHRATAASLGATPSAVTASGGTALFSPSYRLHSSPEASSTEGTSDVAQTPLSTPFASVFAARRVARFLRSQRDKRLVRSQESFRATMSSFNYSLRRHSRDEDIPSTDIQAALFSPGPTRGSLHDNHPDSFLSPKHGAMSPGRPFFSTQKKPLPMTGKLMTPAPSKVSYPPRSAVSSSAVNNTALEERAKAITALRARLSSCFSSLEALRHEKAALEETRDVMAAELETLKGSVVPSLKRDLKQATKQRNSAVRAAETMQREGVMLWRRMLSVAKALASSSAPGPAERSLGANSGHQHYDEEDGGDVGPDAFALPAIFTTPLAELPGMTITMTRLTASKTVAARNGNHEHQHEHEHEHQTCEVEAFAIGLAQSGKPHAAAAVEAAGMVEGPPSYFPLGSPPLQRPLHFHQVYQAVPMRVTPPPAPPRAPIASFSFDSPSEKVNGGAGAMPFRSNPLPSTPSPTSKAAGDAVAALLKAHPAAAARILAVVTGEAITATTVSIPAATQPGLLPARAAASEGQAISPHEDEASGQGSDSSSVTDEKAEMGSNQDDDDSSGKEQGAVESEDQHGSASTFLGPLPSLCLTSMTEEELASIARGEYGY